MHREHVRQDIIRLCHSALTSRALRLELLKRLQTVIPFDFVYFSTTDPATQLLTSSVMIEEPPPWAMAVFVENEFLQDDFNNFNQMLRSHQSVGLLSSATQHDLARSHRYRELLAPMALGDELRAIFVANAACWGTLCLDRAQGSSPFTAAEAAYLAQLAPHIADGLRKALLLDDTGAVTVPDGPGVLILAADLSVVTMTSNAEYWLRELAETEPRGLAALPLTVHSVVAGLFAVERGLAPSSLTPKARLRTRSGPWLILYASRLVGTGQISVIFELAQPMETASLVMQAYDLTPREGEITRCVLLGWSTAEIAAKLTISPNTVQDHLKAIFGKVDVSSRGELAGRIFTRHYQPHLNARMSPNNRSARSAKRD